MSTLNNEMQGNAYTVSIVRKVNLGNYESEDVFFSATFATDKDNIKDVIKQWKHDFKIAQKEIEDSVISLVKNNGTSKKPLMESPKVGDPSDDTSMTTPKVHDLEKEELKYITDEDEMLWD